MSKHDEDMGYISKKNISVQLWLVHVDSTQRMKKARIHLKNIPFVSMHADQLRVEQVVV